MFSEIILLIFSLLGIVGLILGIISDGKTVLQMPYPIPLLAGFAILAVAPVVYLVKGPRRSVRIAAASILALDALFFAGWLGGELRVKQTDRIFLDQYLEISTFDGGNFDGWKPLEWHNNWNDYKQTGDVEIAGSDMRLDNHIGPFLSYPLDLHSDGNGSYRGRNAIYKQMDDAKIIGIMADVYYKPDPKYSREVVQGGFLADVGAGADENYSQELEPNKWNTLIWDLYSPRWWGDENLSKKWQEFLDLAGDDASFMQPGRNLRNLPIHRLGLQFFVDAGNTPEDFKGQVYIDNIVVIYQKP